MCDRRSSLKETTFDIQSYSLDSAALSEGMIPATIHDDIEIARKFLRKTQEQFDKLELQVSRLKYPR